VSSLLHTVKAVAWSFVGIRKNSEYQNDLTNLNPLHVVLVAIVAVILIVLGLVALVHWVVR
jgi:amino acid transporter